MRDLLLTAAVLGSIPFIFYRPHIGVLVWVWLSFMTPFNYAWTFAVDFRFAFIIAAVTMVAWIISDEPKRVVLTTPSVFLLAFWAFTGVTTAFALFPDLAKSQWIELTKIIAIDLVVTTALFSSRRRIDALVWTIILSIGFFGVKGGIGTLASGGLIRVGAVDGSYFADNNFLGAALVMILPLMRYLQLNSRERLVRWSLGIAMALTVIGILGTQSRGAFIGLIVVSVLLLARSRRRVLFSGALITMLALGINFMPDSWTARMQTITAGEVDVSVQGRLDAWRFGYELALERPLTGGGFEAYRSNRDETSSVGYRFAHSVYFQVLGEHGFVGLFIYLVVALSGLLFSVSALRRTSGNPELIWARDLFRMVQISLAAFLVTGAFLSMAYFELFVFLAAITIAADRVLRVDVSAAAQGHRGTAPDALAAGSNSLS